MRTSDVTWVLHNRPDWTLVQHVNRLLKLLMRSSPDEYVIVKIICSFRDGRVQKYDVHRQLSRTQRREMKRFLEKNQNQLSFFYVQLINFQYRDNIRFTLSALAPFEHFDLIGENTPHWLHELINRKFEPEISWRQRLWSFLYNHRPFRNSLSR